MKAVLAFAFVLAAIVAGQQLDALDELRAVQAQADELQAAIKQSQARARFERAAQAICAQEHGGWYEVAPGVIDCATKRGYRTRRGVLVSTGE